jgi:hypothetical protein
VRNMRSLAKAIFSVRWDPGRDTITAILTAVAMVPVYYLGVHGRGNLVGVHDLKASALAWRHVFPPSLERRWTLRRSSPVML